MARSRPNPQAASDKFLRRVQQAGQDYEDGVTRSQGWAQAAQAAAPRRDAGLQQAIADGRINAGISRAGDQKWRQNTLAKGRPNWQAGVAKAGPAYQQGYQRLMGYLDQADAATANQDTSTVEGRIAKAGSYQLAVHRAAQAAKRGG